ncbi:MAG: inositol monophosphatase family protein [Deinococcales bacterium]
MHEGTDPRTPYLHTAIAAAREAARIQLAHLDGELDVDTKSSEVDIVTQVDRLCEARIREVLLGAYPDHVVLGEEQGQEGSGRFRWIVDPLDGTVNYAHGFPFFCVSIALEIDGRVEVGVVYDGLNDELFSAVAGRGATLNGRPLQVTGETVPRRALLATGFAYVDDTVHRNLEVFARMLPQVQSIRRPGAAALDLCAVAAGRLDGFWELGLHPWDVAAGNLIVQEAGGTVTAADGSPYRLGEPTLVVSNGHLHGKLLAMLDLGSAVAG